MAKKREHIKMAVEISGKRIEAKISNILERNLRNTSNGEMRKKGIGLLKAIPLPQDCERIRNQYNSLQKKDWKKWQK